MAEENMERVSNEIEKNSFIRSAYYFEDGINFSGEAECESDIGD